MNNMSRFLILAGIVLIGLGLLMPFLSKIPGIGRLPGDFYIRKENFTFYFPLMTCLIVSLLLTLVMNWMGRK